MLCTACGRTTYPENPAAAVALLVPTPQGLYMSRRGIEPIGLVCLPGGYMKKGESWEEAAARETAEEIQVEIPDPEHNILSFAPTSNSAKTHLIIFGIVRRGVVPIEHGFTPSREVTERFCITPQSIPRDFAFPLHEQMVRRYFAERIC